MLTIQQERITKNTSVADNLAPSQQTHRMEHSQLPTQPGMFEFRMTDEILLVYLEYSVKNSRRFLCNTDIVSAFFGVQIGPNTRNVFRAVLYMYFLTDWDWLLQCM